MPSLDKLKSGQLYYNHVRAWYMSINNVILEAKNIYMHVHVYIQFRLLLHDSMPEQS